MAVCFHVIAAFGLPTPRPPPDRLTLMRDKPMRAGTVTCFRVLSGRSLSRPEKLNARGVMADQSIHHGDERKKELRQQRRMMIWHQLVLRPLRRAPM